LGVVRIPRSAQRAAPKFRRKAVGLLGAIPQTPFLGARGPLSIRGDPPSAGPFAIRAPRGCERVPRGRGRRNRRVPRGTSAGGQIAESLLAGMNAQRTPLRGALIRRL